MLRFVWRLTHPVAPESSLPAWQRLTSELMHWMLYLMVLLTTFNRLALRVVSAVVALILLFVSISHAKRRGW